MTAHDLLLGHHSETTCMHTICHLPYVTSFPSPPPLPLLHVCLFLPCGLVFHGNRIHFLESSVRSRICDLFCRPFIATFRLVLHKAYTEHHVRHHGRNHGQAGHEGVGGVFAFGAEADVGCTDNLALDFECLRFCVWPSCGGASCSQMVCVLILGILRPLSPPLFRPTAIPSASTWTASNTNS